MARMNRAIIVLLIVCAVGCSEQRESIEGYPGGPYSLSLSMQPARVRAGEVVHLTQTVRYSSSAKPVTDLQVAHERLVHNFIVDLDFTHFAHIHHEDFAAFTSRERANAQLTFPYRFPHPGRYRMVSEFAHRDRAWTKHFDIEVMPGKEAAPASPPKDDGYFARLDVVPQTPVAGFETDLRLFLEHNGKPVTDLQLHLGTELHGAVWRDDGKYFGHLHSYTPKVAALMKLAHQRDDASESRGMRIAEMMVQLMCLEAELVFVGPEIPMRYVFPAGGLYHVFLQVAPGGEPRVFQFAIEVADPSNARTTAR